ncbi:MAG TPA: hypothetical protein VHZ24_12070 [Pirellulales bacterium]|nr:hypothetical protein [Pirellulales bacterium]
MLYRQVHPSFVQSGRVTSQAFRPMPKDNFLLSVYDGDLISARDSWTHYTTRLEYLSVGVMAVTVGECLNESLPTRSDLTDFPEHAVVDFSAFQDKVEKKSKALRVVAEKRGSVFRDGVA